MPCRVAPPAPRDSGARPQARGGALPLRISSRIASLPASKALMSRWVCSSKTSRLLSSQLPARSCASVAMTCARRANSLLCSRSWSRISRPVLGASRSAEAAPMRPPRKNQPRYPAASLRSSAMMVSLVLREPGHEDVETLLESRRDADELSGAREPRQAVDGATHALRHGIHAIGHLADALDLVLGFTRELPHVVGERVGLAHERSQLLFDDREHALSTPHHPPQGQ